MTIRLIEGFENLTRQQIFDMSAKHIIQQGRPGWDPISAGCSYSKGCAASIFIPEEDRSFADTVGAWRFLPIDEYETSDFVHALQIAHDDSIHDNECERVADEVFMRTWRARMMELAAREDLDTSVLA